MGGIWAGHSKSCCRQHRSAAPKAPRSSKRSAREPRPHQLVPGILMAVVKDEGWPDVLLCLISWNLEKASTVFPSSPRNPLSEGSLLAPTFNINLSIRTQLRRNTRKVITCFEVQAILTTIQREEPDLGAGFPEKPCPWMLQMSFHYSFAWKWHLILLRRRNRRKKSPFSFDYDDETFHLDLFFMSSVFRCC